MYFLFVEHFFQFSMFIIFLFFLIFKVFYFGKILELKESIDNGVSLFEDSFEEKKPDRLLFYLNKINTEAFIIFKQGGSKVLNPLILFFFANSIIGYIYLFLTKSESSCLLNIGLFIFLFFIFKLIKKIF